MPDIIRDIKQGTDEWLKLRVASIGGTAISAIKPAGNPRAALLDVFVGEYLTGVPAENKKFKYADRGNQYEDAARKCFAATYGLEVEQVAMIKDGPHKHFSPDDLVDDDALAEYKVRLPSVFVRATQERYFPTPIKYQIQWGLHITERERCYYVQYCPEFDDVGDLDPLIVEIIYRDEPLIKDLRSSAAVFISDMHKMADKIRKR